MKEFPLGHCSGDDSNIACLLSFSSFLLGFLRFNSTEWCPPLHLCIYLFIMGPGFLIRFWFTVHACTSSFLTNITYVWPLEIPSVWYLYSCDRPLQFFECFLVFRHSMVFQAHYVPTLNYLWAQPFLRMNSGSLQWGLNVVIKIWAQNVLIATEVSVLL